jgi:hypothetical protein
MENTGVVGYEGAALARHVAMPCADASGSACY